MSKTLTRDALAHALMTNAAVLLLGAGREGHSTYAFLRHHYPQLYLTVADQSPPEQLNADFRNTLQNDDYGTLVSGADYLTTLRTHDLIFKSPGISPLVPELKAATKRGAIITSNAQLFFEMTPQHIRIGITGTKGKSTTTVMIDTILRHGGKDVRLLGNIGTAPLSVLLDDPPTPDTIFVIELSSYQLHDLRQSPEIAVLQNIVPEHLTWHGSFAAYVNAKLNITRFQTPDHLLIYNADHAIPHLTATESSVQRIPFGLDRGNCTLAGDWLTLNGEQIISTADVPLHGAFNLLNVMPGIVIGAQLGLDSATIAAGIQQFAPLAHRLQFVAEIKGVRYYNDSLATVPDAAIAAIEGFRPAGIVLIAGGYDRELSYDALARCLLEENIRHLVLFPTTGERIITALEQIAHPGKQPIPPHTLVDDMPTAVGHAAKSAQAGDVVLLSPASASFNLFRDYHDRGEQFMAAVRALQQ
jgi:UDP-N-acetylmuramoylalanine--D-glutamate ligase